MSLFEERGARFSACRQYRYTLWRTWEPIKPSLVFLMLNPSTADESENDPTVERCQRRALNDEQWGGLIVLNLFAWRSTDPKALRNVADPIGPQNDATITSTCGQSVVCGWGRHGGLYGRDRAVLRLLREHYIKPLCLGLNGDGTPKHPLYVPYSAPLIEVPAV